MRTVSNVLATSLHAFLHRVRSSNTGATAAYLATIRRFEVDVALHVARMA